MRISINGRARRFAVAGTSVAALAMLAAACNYGPDGDQDVLAFAGSDTTQDVVGGIVADYQADLAYNDHPDVPGDDRDILDNILSVETNPNTVQGDEHCGTITYHSPPGAGEVVAPNGSTAGRDALKASFLAGDGCIDIARSSAGPRPIGTGAGQDPAEFEYYAFALDAVGWSTASTAAPANLTLAQLQGIYNCTFTNWNQVGGANQQIERYWPQAGSGTRSFFQSDVLGFDPTTFSNGLICPAVQITQENTGTVIAANGDQQSALEPFSAANYIAMANGAIPDQRAGQVIKDLDGQNIVFNTGTALTAATPEATGNPNAPVQEANVRLNDPTPAYVGIRYVFNVIANGSASYTSAKRYVAFDNANKGATSPLCSGGRKNTVSHFGFGPLNGTIGPNNLAGATCRLF
jgi:ABC-type phosphate transport system substrate-binding protein